MADMERDTQHSQGYHATGAVQDEVMGRVGRTPSVKQGASARERYRFWGRRYETLLPETPRARRPVAPIACPHSEVIWLERPHPRYGGTSNSIAWLRANVGEHAIINIRRVVAFQGPHTCVQGATA